MTLNDPVRIGFIGGGFFGQVAHLRNFAQLKSCRIVALAEMRADLRQKVADRYSIPQRFASHAELLANSDIEAVVVVTARQAMGPIVLDCLNAGKHVLSEKPMAGNSELAGALCDAATRKGLLYSVGYMKRHDAGVQAAKTLLEQLRTSKQLGQLTYVRAQCFAGDAYFGESDYERSSLPRPTALAEWPLAPSWLSSDQHRGYDRYLNTYCHDINLLRYLIGSPAIESAYLSGNSGVVALSCDGSPMLLETGLVEHSGWEESFQFFFERGWMTIRMPAPLNRDVPAAVELYRGVNGANAERLEVPASWAFRRQAEAFICDVRTGNQPLNTARDAQLDVEIVEEIWRKAHKST